MKIRFLSWITLVAFLVVAPQAFSQAPSKLKPGDSAPNFRVKLLDGSKVQLKELRGRVVVLNFWFMACPPCLLEMPDLNELVDHFQGKPVSFIALTPDTAPELKKFLEVRQFKYDIAPESTHVADQYGVAAAPVHIVITPEGKIHSVQYGVINQLDREMIEPIDKLLAAR